MLVTWVSISQVDSVQQYIQSVKSNGTNFTADAFLFQDQENRELYEKIQQEAAKREEKPINARIDRVWKGIQGYSGLQVDVEKTYELALQSKDGEIPYVYRQIPPAITLDDLPPNPIYKGNSQKPMAAIMINVAWGDEFLPSILETLQKENVRATFFFDGTWLSKHIETAKKMVEMGHEASNHAYSHQEMSKLGRTAAMSEIQKTEALLKEKVGVTNRWFAPPSGDFNMETVKIAHELGLKTVLWTIDTIDWKKPEPGWIVKRIEQRIEPGAMILMHPTQSSSEALPGMIKAIKSKGLSLGTVSDLLSVDRVLEPKQLSQPGQVEPSS
ncbi:polysaccharide deacetylase family protein [Paenibacillus turpanensis]|uniref:polysaccharide deacetylase family protein n=1 Tax=Paenibacillus turpanensis TaxID=2689078 RepID=UPI00140C4F89|nr:polysaccharide deacetylase family protein [Paenibacillus turpanensis]